MAGLTRTKLTRPVAEKTGTKNKTAATLTRKECDQGKNVNVESRVPNGVAKRISPPLDRTVKKENKRVLF